MEDGRDACANLAKAAAALTVLSLLPVALSGSAPSHASAGLPLISPSSLAAPPASSNDAVSSVLFGSFAYGGDRVAGSYVTFAYDAAWGPIRSYLAKNVRSSVLYVDSIDIGAFTTLGDPQVRGPTFHVAGSGIEITAHDDPTGLLEIRTSGARNVTIDLPSSAANISQRASEGPWPASLVSYTIGEGHARFVLGAGSFSVSGTRIIARMTDSDLLVFKAVPAASEHRAAWRAVLDAVASGRIVAEFDLVATSPGQWIENSVRYRIDVTAWPQEVAPGKASVHVNSPGMTGAFVLLAFDPTTMPVDGTRELWVRANGVPVNFTADPLGFFYAPELSFPGPAYTVLPLPGTVLAVYLPSLASTSVEVESTMPPPPAAFGADSALAVILALLVVTAAASHMFRRRESRE